MTDIKIIIIAGPTASGKSSLALGIAKRLNGVIINADSQQIYKDLQILSARPSEDEMQGIEHRLYGIWGGDDKCSAGKWVELAKQEIVRTHKAGKVPMLVGGTGLYIKALLEGIAPIPQIAPEIRQRGCQICEQHGTPELHSMLHQIDPIMAERLNQNDSQRVIRAWEVMTATGRSLAEWQNDATPALPPDWRFYIFSKLPDRQEVYDKCNTRLETMVNQGALDEVRALMAQGYAPDSSVMKAIGVPEFCAHIRGEMELDEALIIAKQSTRRYAKRQMTWLRHQILGSDIPAVIVNEIAHNEDQIIDALTE